MITEKKAPSALPFLDMQAAVGITKHAGGYAATDELLALCHLEQASAVLNVGCGIGVGSVYMARQYGCHVVGIMDRLALDGAGLGSGVAFVHYESGRPPGHQGAV